jgi:hypothetical protein
MVVIDIIIAHFAYSHRNSITASQHTLRAVVASSLLDLLYCPESSAI